MVQGVAAPGPVIGRQRTLPRKRRRTGEQAAAGFQRRLEPPIHWDRVPFLLPDRPDRTRNPAFTANLLFFLLESQRDDPV